MKIMILKQIPISRYELCNNVVSYGVSFVNLPFTFRVAAYFFSIISLTDIHILCKWAIFSKVQNHHNLS